MGNSKHNVAQQKKKNINHFKGDAAVEGYEAQFTLVAKRNVWPRQLRLRSLR